jgi:hypothetical protein
MQVLQKLSPSSSRFYLRGSFPPNAIPTFNGPNTIRNIQMMFITKANHHSNEKDKTIPAFSGQIPLWKE